ncbi:SIR2 family protein [Mycolicibacterium sp. GESEQ-9]|uniref:SIR2 family protein n=1 Tax=Mycolicibacterium sp. GESEQ-9 TaxID=2812656 RepID=UPI0027DEA4C2|nr:SIR2 family protein [Mycolicibacterium sp. GESEQ-9]
MERLDLINIFGEAVLEGNAALFVGAGLSLDAGVPTWSDLLAELRGDCEVPEELTDLPLVAEYIDADVRHGGRDRLEHHILDLIVAANPTPTESHLLIPKLRVKEIWTTNYDELIEQAVPAAAVAIEEPDIQSIGSAKATIIKMHGSVVTAERRWAKQPVITRSDYESYEVDRPRTWSLLRAAYLSRTFLFLGFSFTDPNIEILLRLARTLGTHVHDRHMTVLRRPAEQTTQRRLHDLRVNDLESSGVRVLQIDDFDEIVPLLNDLVRRTRPPRIFISGSQNPGADGGEPNRDVIVPWCQAVANVLIGETGWELTSLGGPAGWDVTSSVALARRAEATYDPNALTFHFRAKEDAPPPMEMRVGTAVYTDLAREQLVGSLLDECRAMLVIRGGQRTAEEIAWAQDRGVGIIPIAASGGAARDYWLAHAGAPPMLGGQPVQATTWANLDSDQHAVAARAAYELLKQAMYRY